MKLCMLCYTTFVFHWHHIESESGNIMDNRSSQSDQLWSLNLKQQDYSLVDNNVLRNIFR